MSALRMVLMSASFEFLIVAPSLHWISLYLYCPHFLYPGVRVSPTCEISSQGTNVRYYRSSGFPGVASPPLTHSIEPKLTYAPITNHQGSMYGNELGLVRCYISALYSIEALGSLGYQRPSIGGLGSGGRFG